MFLSKTLAVLCPTKNCIAIENIFVIIVSNPLVLQRNKEDMLINVLELMANR